MEIRQLRYFVAVAEDRHFRKAAARRHIAQPAVSEQIRKVEVEVVTSTLRDVRSSSLTPTCETSTRSAMRRGAPRPAAAGACGSPSRCTRSPARVAEAA
jgi:DNA-binding transcriptional LysR family regulator